VSKRGKGEIKKKKKQDMESCSLKGRY